jgi:hypothetical protein
MTIGELAGASALVAAAATIIGAVTLGMFFAKGGAWGLLNDVSSVVLMLAMVPIAGAVAILTADLWPINVIVAAMGVVGMLGAATAQALLVTRRGTFRALLPWNLGSGAIVGVWYIVVGLLGFNTPLGEWLSALAIISGVGFIAIGIGFWGGNQQSRLALVGGIVLLVSSTWFLTWLGLELLSGRIPVGGAG